MAWPNRRSGLNNQGGVNGYPNLGAQRRPFIPAHFILTDRDDGTLWHLSWSTEGPSTPDGLGRIMITDILPRQTWDYRVYPVGEEPLLAGDPRIRFFVRGGRVGMDIVPLPQGIRDMDQRRIVARVLYQTTIREIILPVGFDENLPPPGPRNLAWTTESLLNG